MPHNNNIQLTERERQVLEWLTAGKSAWEIGTILGLSPRTVEWYISQTNRKLHTVNTVQTVSKAICYGLIKAMVGLSISVPAMRRLFDAVSDNLFWWDSLS